MNTTQVKKFYSVIKNSGAKISIEFDGYYIHIVSNYWALEITSMDWIALSQLFEKECEVLLQWLKDNGRD